MKTPFFSTASKIVLAIALIVTGYFGAQAMRAELQARPRPLSAIDEADIALKMEANKPRFIGDIDGIFIAPQGTPVPEHYTTYEDVCGNQYGKSVPWSQAGELDLTLDLPEDYVLNEDALYTDVVACGDTVFVAHRGYTTKSGEVSIGRSLFDHDELDVAVDRPKIEHINGRDVVIIESLTSDGIFQGSYAYFPETFGKTFISANSMPQAEFRDLVALVASSTR